MFSPIEAEQILREGWTDATSVGGFENASDRQHTLECLRETHGAAMEGYRLIGETRWSDFEEGSQVTLWIRLSDDSLWTFSEGYSVMIGEYGVDFAAEIAPTNMTEWLETVKSTIDHCERFIGC